MHNKYPRNELSSPCCQNSRLCKGVRILIVHLLSDIKLVALEYFKEIKIKKILVVKSSSSKAFWHFYIVNLYWLTKNQRWQGSPFSYNFLLLTMSSQAGWVVMFRGGPWL